MKRCCCRRPLWRGSEPWGCIRTSGNTGPFALRGVSEFRPAGPPVREARPPAGGGLVCRGRRKAQQTVTREGLGRGGRLCPLLARSPCATRRRGPPGHSPGRTPEPAAASSASECRAGLSPERIAGAGYTRARARAHSTFPSDHRPACSESGSSPSPSLPQHHDDTSIKTAQTKENAFCPFAPGEPEPAPPSW